MNHPEGPELSELNPKINPDLSDELNLALQKQLNDPEERAIWEMETLLRFLCGDMGPGAVWRARAIQALHVIRTKPGLFLRPQDRGIGDGDIMALFKERDRLRAELHAIWLRDADQQTTKDEAEQSARLRVQKRAKALKAKKPVKKKPTRHTDK